MEPSWRIMQGRVWQSLILTVALATYVVVSLLYRNVISDDTGPSKGCHRQFCWKKWQFLSIFLKKMSIFVNFFEKNVRFLAIFWHWNDNFAEGQLWTNQFLSCCCVVFRNQELEAVRRFYRRGQARIQSGPLGNFWWNNEVYLYLRRLQELQMVPRCPYIWFGWK